VQEWDESEKYPVLFPVSWEIGLETASILPGCTTITTITGSFFVADVCQFQPMRE
jgi:hypothetical protein